MPKMKSHTGMGKRVKVTGSGKDIPLRDALKQLLDPLGLRAIVRDEVVILTVR